MHVNLETKTLTELIELKRLFSGTKFFLAIDGAYKIKTEVPFSRMMSHRQKRNAKRRYK